MFKVTEEVMKKIESVVKSNVSVPAYENGFHQFATPPCGNCINSCSGGCHGTCTATCSRRSR